MCCDRDRSDPIGATILPFSQIESVNLGIAELELPVLIAVGREVRG